MILKRETGSRQHILLMSVCYFLPFALLFLIDISFFKRPYYAFPNDATPGMFGLGLGWLTGAPKEIFHIPGHTFNQITAFLILAVGQPTHDLAALNSLGVALQIVFTILASLWAGWILSRLSAGPLLAIALGAITATMPTMALHATIWHIYYPTGLVIAPACLALLCALAAQKPSPTIAWTSFAGLAFAAANHFGTLILFVAIATALFAAGWRHPSIVLDRIARAGSATALETIFLAIGIAAASITVLFLLRPRWWPQYMVIATVIGAVVGICATFAFRLSGALIDRLARGIALPSLLGWLVGANLAFGAWGISARLAFTQKGGASSGYSAMETFSTLKLIEYINEWKWHWFIIMLVGIGMYGLTRGRQKSKFDHVRMFVSVFCLIAVFLNTLVVADMTLIKGARGIQLFGQSSRYFVMMIGPVAVGLAWLMGQATGRFVAILVAMVLIGASADYWRAVSSTSIEIEANRHLESLVKNHLSGNSGNIIVCRRASLPVQCGVLYGYNNYRTDESIARLPRTELASGRILYLSDGTSQSDLDSLRNLGKQTKGSVLIIHEDTPGLVPFIEPIWKDAQSGTIVSLLRKP